MDRSLAAARRRHPSRPRTFRPGDVVDLPADTDGWGACRALLVETNVPNADGIVDEPGVHDWLILWCDDDPAAVGTIASHRIEPGATFVRRDPKALMAARAIRNGLARRAVA